MSEVVIQSIGRALPEQTWTQEALFAHSPFEETPLIQRLFLASPIEERHLFVPPSFYFQERSLTETNEAWRQGALALGGAALRDGLERAGKHPEQVDQLSVTTVTGYTTPGLDLLLLRQEGLRGDVARAHFNCIGCHAALPLLKVASEHVRAHPGDTAVSLAVEVCSACFTAEPSSQNLVALSLFADGAAAVVLGSEGPGPRVLDFASHYALDHLDALGFDLTTTGFRIILDPSIPQIIGQAIDDTVRRLLSRHGLCPADVSLWAFHPGGSRILDAVQQGLGLTDAHMAPSRRVLARCGNMSSPSVMFVLAEALADGMGDAGGFGVLAAFGPGLGIECCLLQL